MNDSHEARFVRACCHVITARLPADQRRANRVLDLLAHMVSNGGRAPYHLPPADAIAALEDRFVRIVARDLYRHNLPKDPERARRVLAVLAERIRKAEPVS